MTKVKHNTMPHNLPKYVGIVMDPNYERRIWVSNMIEKMKAGSVIVTPQMGKSEEFIERESILRGHHSKIFSSEPWEITVAGKHKADQLRDYLFLTYLRFYKGQLMIFPKRYKTTAYGDHYSGRMQDLIILAHQLGVKYNLIPVEDD